MMTDFRIVKVNEDLKIIFRFNISDDFESTLSKITIRFAEIYFKDNERKFIDSYTDWFKSKGEKTWFSKYGNPKYEPHVINLLKEHKAWAQKIKLDHIPATIIRNTFYPN